MAELITCPIDGTPLVMASDSGVFETACHECKRSFRITRGVLQACETKSTKTAGRQQISMRIHVEHETVEVHDSVATGRWRTVDKKADITTIEQLGPGDETRLVQVRSRNAPPFEPREPGDQAVIRTAGLVVQSGLAATFATILAVYFYHWAFLVLVPVAAVGIAIAAFLRWKTTTTRQPLDKTRWAHLEREQWLLEQVQRYRLQASEVQTRLKRGARQIEEMEGLARDMASAKGDYVNRLAVVQRGIAALQTHRECDQRLQTAIADAMEMVEIEYRAARALQYLPDDAIGRLTTTLAELDSINSERVQLESLLEAQAEVEALAPA